MTRKQKDSYLAKRMFGKVMTNLCCWIPDGIFTFLALGGLTSNVKTLHAWSAVCRFWINAAINPIIYTYKEFDFEGLSRCFTYFNTSDTTMKFTTTFFI